MILRFTRFWLPAIVVLVGLGLWIASPSVDTAEGSAGIIGAGLSIWLLNFLYRVGVKGDRERRDEDDARAFMEEHGHWPDESPPDRTPRHRRPRD
jgi:hypothetical protein